jgi:hypothetical protein
MQEQNTTGHYRSIMPSLHCRVYRKIERSDTGGCSSYAALHAGKKGEKYKSVIRVLKSVASVIGVVKSAIKI